MQMHVRICLNCGNFKIKLKKKTIKTLCYNSLTMTKQMSKAELLRMLELVYAKPILWKRRFAFRNYLPERNAEWDVVGKEMKYPG